MRTVWKYEVKPDGQVHEIEMPEGAWPVMVGVQSPVGSVMAWFEVETDRDLEKRRFIVHGTDHEIAHDQEWIGSVVAHASLVWHLYEIKGDT